MIIHGDNLHALKALLPKYRGKVNCTYIDPPYNTGNEGWKYNDNVNHPRMKEWFKKEVGIDDMQRHDKWLCMMWPRLQLLRELLSDDGIIFISIDDNEQHRLKIIMDDIFGEDNFLSDIIWQHRYGRSNNAKLFSNQREHILAYRKSDKLDKIRVKRDSKLNATYENPDNDSRGKWIASSYVSPVTKDKRPNLTYTIINPQTKKKIIHPTHAWKYSFDTYQDHLKNNKLWWGKNHDYKYPRLKNFLSESENKGIVPIDLMLSDSSGTTDEGTRMLQDIFQNNALNFNNPKPVRLIKNLIGIAEGHNHKTDSVILDSFAGSGTTAHAVLSLNNLLGGNRKFILIEQEKYADNITAERIRRVIKGVPKSNESELKNGLGGSFSYYTLGKSIDKEEILTGKILPDYSDLASHLLYTVDVTTTDKKLHAGKDGLFHSNGYVDYYLLYKPNLKYMQSSKAVLSEDMIKRIYKKNRKAIVFAASKNMTQSELAELNIQFCRIPDYINKRL